ncbi:hypothetical protein NBRC116493_04500 [Aurantivibrio infirmus]
MRNIFLIIVICSSLSACVTRTVFVSEPVISTSVEESPQQRRQEEWIKKNVEKPQYRESALFFDSRKATLSLRAAVLPASRGAVNDGASLSRERVISYQILIQTEETERVESIILRTPSKSFPLEAKRLVSPLGQNIYIELSGDDATEINPNEDALLVFMYKGKLVSAVIIEHQLSNVIESYN